MKEHPDYEQGVNYNMFWSIFPEYNPALPIGEKKNIISSAK
jgi:hypothetical protein